MLLAIPVCSNSCAACKIRLQFLKKNQNAPRPFVSLVQTNLGTKSVCSLVTKRSNGFGYTNLDHSRVPIRLKKTTIKNGFGPFSYKFFVPIRVELEVPIVKNLIIKNAPSSMMMNVLKEESRENLRSSGGRNKGRLLWAWIWNFDIFRIQQIQPSSNNEETVFELPMLW